ncbi:uncharacterized protein AB675_2726 [Cyphellophora attinorum]|uniref:Lysine-specific metallo-endopeptidase domain-containing protein n=1 Tax=Cyphellophora attinorum TaxID=1664694 RepID=A0A0N1HG97_9EURO|nr:uncharacterized protein AB675_2726 [Phialophora attinorum]KPI45147.1 hypothetical protein AB675_2726 [Phialophora attinorum]
MVDSSCSKVPGFADAVREAISASTRAFSRIVTPDDDRGDFLFNLIYSTPRASGGAAVSLNFAGIGSLNPVEGSPFVRANSNIRLYCDNDARWKPSEQQPGWVQDKDNGMVAPESSLCTTARDSNGQTGNLWGVRFNGRAPRVGENARRFTITLCDALLFPGVPVPSTFLNTGGKLLDWARFVQRTGLDEIRGVLSFTILHELAHCFNVPGDYAYGWEKVVALAAPQSLENADSYAFFGALSILPDFWRYRDAAPAVPSRKRRARQQRVTSFSS